MSAKRTSPSNETASPERAIHRIPPEVWSRILANLRKPTPRPDGRRARTELRQDDLTRAMRVNTVFHDEAGKHLYTTVITDNLRSFAFGLATPGPHPSGRNTKLELVRRVTGLALEYADKKLDETFSYDVASLHFGSAEDNRKLQALTEPLQREVRDIRNGLGTLIPVFAASGSYTKLTLMAYLGGEAEIWKTTRCGRPDIGAALKSDVAQCRQCVRRAIMSWQPTLVRICQRGLRGPLSLPGFFPPDLIPATRVCFHLPRTSDALDAPDPLCDVNFHPQPVRIYDERTSFDAVPHQYDLPKIQGFAGMGFIIEFILSPHDNYPVHRETPKRPFDLRFYRSTPRYAQSAPGDTFEPETDMMAAVQREVQGRLDQEFCGAQVRISHIREAPQCEACGWQNHMLTEPPE